MVDPIYESTYPIFTNFSIITPFQNVQKWLEINGSKECLTSQLCELTGGPCKYTCRNMKDTHAGMGVTTADFNALVEDLVTTLNKFKVGKPEQDQLLAILGPMQKDIVEKQ